MNQIAQRLRSGTRFQGHLLQRFFCLSSCINISIYKRFSPEEYPRPCAAHLPILTTGPCFGQHPISVLEQSDKRQRSSIHPPPLIIQSAPSGRIDPVGIASAPPPSTSSTANAPAGHPFIVSPSEEGFCLGRHIMLAPPQASSTPPTTPMVHPTNKGFFKGAVFFPVSGDWTSLSPESGKRGFFKTETSAFYPPPYQRRAEPGGAGRKGKVAKDRWCLKPTPVCSNPGPDQVVLPHHHPYRRGRSPSCPPPLPASIPPPPPPGTGPQWPTGPSASSIARGSATATPPRAVVTHSQGGGILGLVGQK